MRIGKAKKNETKRKGITKDDGISTIESGKVELTTSPELPTQATGMQKLRKLRLWRSMLQKASGSDPWGPTIYAKVGFLRMHLIPKFFDALFASQCCIFVADFLSVQIHT